MSRRESSGGGQSSLGYLFGSDEGKKKSGTTSPPATPIVYAPPYGIDTDENLLNPSDQDNSNKNNNVVSKNYRSPHGPNSGNIITGRPSTKVKSVPGGDSSLGYLFGDNKS